MLTNRSEMHNLNAVFNAVGKQSSFSLLSCFNAAGGLVAKKSDECSGVLNRINAAW
jgi:hypothetical protein